ncbi:MAG: isochorismatase family cysteine hydrolase [Anaerolineae bacterium]|nr:cysteine hydrolase [Anaerolineae bacterium]MDW8068603.1 isochorismatase family cysteine hydrolase [Anaerolineae bacterium]
MKAHEVAFLEWLERWEAELPAVPLESVVREPARTAILSVDLIKGFCTIGPLASPRVAGIVPYVVRLFEQAYALGVRHFLLTQDAHDPNSVEFAAFPAHCVAGTPESETVDELRALPFSDLFVVIPKKSISSSIGTDFVPWLDSHPAVNTFIVVGDCTDLCIYQAAMFLRLRANVQGLRDFRVVVPASGVQTYDMPVETALQLGILPHDGDLLHRVFLYSMALNGIEVVARLI